MAAKSTKAKAATTTAPTAKATDAAPGPALEEGASASASGASAVAPTGAAPGADGSDGAAGDSPPAGAPDGAGNADGDTTATGDATDNLAGGVKGDGAVDTSAPANGPPADADALATAAAESTAAAFEASAQNLSGLDVEGAAAATMAALLDAQTTQTEDESALAEPVALNVWGLPEITDFPALLTLSNNTASRFSVKSVNRSIQPHESITAEFDWEQYENLKRSLAGPARLDKWDSLYGVQVKHEPDQSSND